MSISFSALTHSLRKQSQAAGTDIKLSHCQQLLAAAFGYKSLAAMQAAQADFAETPDFDGVDSVCLNQKILALRACELGVALDSTELVSTVAAALRANLPKAYVYVGEDAWSEGIREYITALVERNSDVIGLIADTNNNGTWETHVPFDLSNEVVPPPEQTLSTNMQVRITLDVDLERPYAGHQIDVTVDLRITRLGRALWGAPRGHVTFWKLAEDEPQRLSLAQAFAAEFGIAPKEAEELVDAEALPVEGHDGAEYGYYFDFEDYASPAVAAKLMTKYGRLNNLRVGPDFFDRVSTRFY